MNNDVYLWFIFRNEAAIEMRRGIIDGIPGTLRHLANKEYLHKAGMLLAPPVSVPLTSILPNFNADYYAAFVAAVAATKARM